VQILRAESLRSRNTLSLDSRASALAEVASEEALHGALQWAQAQGLDVLPLGSGSNVVLAGDVEALVVCQTDQVMNVLSERGDEVDVRVSAGHDWHGLVERTLAAGLYGLENLALIPGRVGAAPIQNIGAYGVELERFVQSVHAVDIASGKPRLLTAADCKFGYRDSVFKGELSNQMVITAVDLCLSRKARPELSYPTLQTELAQSGVGEPGPLDIFRAVVDVRRRRLPDPNIEPNAGSFFKNPVVDSDQARHLSKRYPQLPLYPLPDGRAKLPAAWLIDQAGWKGQRRGGVGVHPGHALVLVNYSSGDGQELLALAAEIVDSVQRRFGVRLVMEPRVYGRASE
jgi:UDP-N-acetylmuramate dehydrogenase